MVGGFGYICAQHLCPYHRHGFKTCTVLARATLNNRQFHGVQFQISVHETSHSMRMLVLYSTVVSFLECFLFVDLTSVYVDDLPSHTVHGSFTSWVTLRCDYPDSEAEARKKDDRSRMMTEVSKQGRRLAEAVNKYRIEENQGLNGNVMETVWERG